MGVTFIFLVVGFMVSFLATITGISGGIILMPVLVIILAKNGAAESLHLAINTSLVIILLNSLINMYQQNRAGRINWSFTLQILPGAFIGVMIGVLLRNIISPNNTLVIAGLLLLFLAVMTLYNLTKAIGNIALSVQKTFGLATLIGIPTSYIGIGGGSVLVPVFNFAGANLGKVIGSAATLSAFTSLVTIVSFMSISRITNSTFDFDHLAILIIFPSMFVGAVLGSKLLTKMSLANAKTVLALVLVCMGSILLIKGLFS